MIKFSYEDLLSGDRIYIDGIGHFRSPRLREINPTEGIGYFAYKFYVSVLSWDKGDFLKYMKAIGFRQSDLLGKTEKLNAFDVMTLAANFRPLLTEALGFFLSEEVLWMGEEHKFITQKDGKDVGWIDRENFDEVRDMMLQLNCINLGKASVIKHSSKKAQKYWERAQAYLKEESAKSPKEDNFNLGNIISKLCASGCGYTLLNIYDLTVFQLWDQFFQYSYLRAVGLSERIFSNHGGEKFDIRDWLKPITKF